MSSPQNSQRLSESIAQIESANVVTNELIEE